MQNKLGGIVMIEPETGECFVWFPPLRMIRVS